MDPQKSLLLVSTLDDPSLDLFKKLEKKLAIKVSILRYGELIGEIESTKQPAPDFVYFRDPFNYPLATERVKRTIQSVFDSYNKDQVRSVDNIYSYQDMLLEDKLLQYQQFSDLMPSTKVVQDISKVNFSRSFVKPRISCRARGIIFSENEVPPGMKPSDYIQQERLDIVTEYRVFMVGGEVIYPYAIKTSKTEYQKTKIVDVAQEPIREIENICDKVYTETNYDLIGVDIAKTKHGYFLLECNRSCQLAVFHKMTSIDLAEKLVNYLTKTPAK